MQQDDGHNCGAITGLKVMECFDVKGSVIESHKEGFRALCLVGWYKQVLNLCKDDIGVVISKPKMRRYAHENRKREAEVRKRNVEVVVEDVTDDERRNKRQMRIIVEVIWWKES
jgi:hypothetical protein